MNTAIKSDTSINGMKINNSEYLLSQFVVNWLLAMKVESVD
jgi:hypothetical protein